MKIDKIVFSCSEEFSPFWNTQSWIWKEKLGIEPICLLWGKVKNTNMSDKYGEIIEKDYSSFWNKTFQMTWSKFFHPSTEPDKNWLIGDIDNLPLQTEWFTDRISDLGEDVYTHLAYGEIARLAGRPIDTFETSGGYMNGNNGMDLTAFYHLAKGKVFVDALGLDEGSFDEQVERVVNSKKFGMGAFYGMTEEQCSQQFGHIPIPKEELYYWCADENYTSYRIFNALKEGKVNFKSHITYWENGEYSKKLDRAWMHDPSNYIYDKKELKENKYIDIHCQRPFELQRDSLKEIVETAWGGWFE